ncbi:MAG: glucose-6-phosphate isomerase [Balneola sp.]
MISLNTDLAKAHLSQEEFSSSLARSKEAHSLVTNKSGKGSEWLGWRDILDNPNDALLEKINALAKSVRSDADVLIVCGIGGSYLGAKAVIDALAPHFKKRGPEILFAGHHMGGKYLKELLEYIQAPKEDGLHKKVYVNVISKSGSTLETALSFRMIREVLYRMYGNEADNKIICTTSESGGVLNELIAEKGYKKFIIPGDVGGRFSVLTPVGLIPIAIAGIDIKTLFYGAVSAFNKFENDPTEILVHASVRRALHEKGVAIDIFSCFEPELQSFGGWIQQLMGESEGKEGMGIFPAVASFSTDLHSLGQFIQQGKRSVMETFITVEKPISDLKVNSLDGDHDKLNYLSGKVFHDINTKARIGTTEAHKDGGVPIINLSIKALNAEAIGELIYYFELLTAVYVYSLGINPFDQPGVEDYKKAMYRLLGKD